MGIRIQLDVFGFIDVKSVVVKIKLQQIKMINPTVYRHKRGDTY